MTSDFLKLFGLGQAANIPFVGNRPPPPRPSVAPPTSASPAPPPSPPPAASPSGGNILASLFGGGVSGGDSKFRDFISKFAGGLQGIRPGDDFWTAAARGFGGSVKHGDELEAARKKAGLDTEDRQFKRTNEQFDQFLRGRADDRAERADTRAGSADARAASDDRRADAADRRAGESHATDLDYKRAQTDWMNRRKDGTGRLAISGGVKSDDVFKFEQAVSRKAKELGFGTDEAALWDDETKAAKSKELDEYRADLLRRLNEQYDRMRKQQGATGPAAPTAPVSPTTPDPSDETADGWEDQGSGIRIRPQP